MEYTLDLQQYLKGALAGRIADRANHQTELAGENDPDRSAAMRLKAPAQLQCGERRDISIRIRNPFGRDCSGTLTLRGEDQLRGVIYDFHSDFQIEADQNGTRISFSWQSPDYSTEVVWTATVNMEGQMGVGLPGERGVTRVVDS
ncbi:MAG: hypothetical protein C0616_00570 [Desulfuromonas sp.]|nr:MAG: hypothetical protein C0616_00570 [Desulfuromonas sp.]